nr:DNA-directed DNA polymerase [Tanacetum cinerariifolium]
MKAITTRSGVAYEGPLIPTPKKVVEHETEETTNKEKTNFQGSTTHIQPPVTPIPKPDVPKTLPKPNIPYPLRINDQKLRKKAMNQMEKFFQIFQDLHFDISFVDALLLMLKFASTVKSLLTNKDKLFELAKIPLNQNCLAMLLKKLPEKLRDPGKFLIPCDFPGMHVCHALADLSVSINLMPLSIWKNLSLPELTPNQMTLELVNRSITHPKGVVEDVYVKVGKFHFLTDFVVVDFEADPRVPPILGRSFLRTDHALIDVYGEEITIRVNDEAVTFNLNQTTRYSSTYDDTSKIIDIKGIDPRFCTHKILMEEDYKPAVQSQRWVNKKIHEVIKKEVIKLLDAGMIYLISDSLWVSPIHCVPKKGRITIVENENNELIPTWLVTGWRVYIDYRKLNDATRKDHFPLPFMDQMLERLAGNEFYCFLDGFSGYIQILINPPDQEKTTFTCPYGTFSYRIMPFSLCNAPGTFQRYYASTVRRYQLSSKLGKVPLMVIEGIVLGHKISKNGLEVDRAKVDVIAKLPYPTTVKGVRSFIRHACFYQRIIQDFSKIARPMTHLLEKETSFVFSKDCIDAFETLKKKLIEAPILVVPDWNLPFELMCDASDFVIGAVLGQRKTKHFQPIHYTRKTMIEPQIHYTTTEKEMLAVVYAFEKFRPYLVLSKSIVYTDHSALKYLLKVPHGLLTLQISMRGISSSKGSHLSKRRNSLRTLNITYGMILNFFKYVWIKSFEGLCMAKKLMISSKLVVKDPPGAIMVPISPSRKTAYKTPIWCTPYKLVYEKSCHLPIELEHNAYWALKHVNFDLKTVGDHQMLQLNELNKLRDQAYENSWIYKEKTKKIQDSKIKTAFSMTFTITKVFPYGTVELSQPDGPNFKVNGHRVKHYFGGDVPKLVVPNLRTFPMNK